MNYIKNFVSFSLNESVMKADVNEIKDDISDRLMDLGTSIDLDVTDLIFSITNIISADLDDVIYCVNWIISYCSSNGYNVELSAGNYSIIGDIGFFIPDCKYENLDDVSEQLTILFDELKKLKEFELRRYGNDNESTGYYLKISLKARKLLTYMVYIDDKVWGEFTSNLPKEEFEKEMQNRLLDMHPLNMSDDGAEEYRSRYKNSKVTVKGGW